MTDPAAAPAAWKALWLLNSYQLWHCHCNHWRRESAGLVSVAPAQKQKECTWKSPSQNALAKIVKDKEKMVKQNHHKDDFSEPLSRSSQEPEEEIKQTWLDAYPWVNSGRHKQISAVIHECITAWLLCWWDNDANSVEWEGKEARLGSLAKDPDICKAVGRKAQVFSLWRWFLPSVRRKGIPVEIIVHVI